MQTEESSRKPGPQDSIVENTQTESITKDAESIIPVLEEEGDVSVLEKECVKKPSVRETLILAYSSLGAIYG
ncbi:hypothetical protein OXX69_011042, partial [Metschnikowia pulcherrima]